MEIFKTIFLYLTVFNANAEENLSLLNQVLVIDPCDYQLHYNFGFMYHRANKLDSSVYHYKLANGIIDLQMKLAKDKNEINILKQFKIERLHYISLIWHLKLIQMIQM